MAGRCFITLCLLTLGLSGSAAQAREQGGRVDRVRLLRTEESLLCDLDLSGLFTSPIESTLRSGLPVVVDVAMVMLPSTGREQGRLLRSELSYDVWEDLYTLRRGTKETVFDNFDALRLACRRYRGLALKELGRPGDRGELRLRLRVSVNPLGGRERQRMARWLAETVSDPDDPANRELLLDLGGLIGSFFSGGEEVGWGQERSFGPYKMSELIPVKEKP